MWKSWLVACLMLVICAGSALAHGMVASITLAPESPPPGQPADLLVQLLDPYGNPIEEAEVAASVGPMDAPPPELVPLVQAKPGQHQGRLTFPDGVVAVIRLSVILPDDQWKASVPVRMGEEWFKVSALPIELTMVGAPKTEPIPPHLGGGAPATPGSSAAPKPTVDTPVRPIWPFAAGGVVAVLGVALLVVRRSKK